MSNTRSFLVRTCIAALACGLLLAAFGDDTTAPSSQTAPPTSDAPVATSSPDSEADADSVASDSDAATSASATMTGHLLAIEVPVAATQVLPPQSPLADDSGFMLQWADAAMAAGIETIAGPEMNIEAIAAIEPDLIVGNAFGGDAITEDVYALLSEITPTVVIDHSGMEWQELAATLAEATGHQHDAEHQITAFDARITDLAATIDTDQPVVAGVITAEGINVFTAESSHGKLLTALGLEVVEIDGGALEGEQRASTRTDVVNVSPELVPDLFGDATILFVFGTQDDIDQALELYPTLGATPAAVEGRLVPLGPESFRLDRYSAELTADRVAAALG